MITGLTDEQKMLEDGCLRLAESLAPKRGLAPGEIREADPALWRQMTDMGWPSVIIPEALGGYGGGAVEVFLIGRAHGLGLLITPFLGASVLCGAILRACADRAGAGEALGGLASGDRQIALAHFERSVSQDVAQMVTRTVCDGAGYLLNGEKVAVFGGAEADSYIVSARLGEGGELALLRVPAAAAGLKVTPRRLVDGQPAAWMAFTDVRVEEDQVLAAGEDARAALEGALALGMVEAIGEAVGVLEAGLRIARDYIKTRKQFGRPLAAFQVLQHRLADMYMIGEEVAALGLAAAKALAGQAADAETLVRSAKVHVGTDGVWAAEQAVHLHGAMGVTNEAVIGQYLKRMVVADRLFGDAEHHLSILADAAKVAA